MYRLFIALAILTSSVVHAQVSMFQRGDVARMPEVARPTEFRVVGVPGDRIRADETGVYVNDVAVTGFFVEFLTRWLVEPKEVAQGHYFVMGEQRVNDQVSENISFVPGSSLEPVR